MNAAVSSGRLIITLADCRSRGAARPVTYVDEKAPHLYRHGGRQCLFVQIDAQSVQLASCGTHRNTLSARATRRQVSQLRAANRISELQEGPECPGKPPAR